MKQARSHLQRSPVLAAGIVLALLVVAGLGILAAQLQAWRHRHTTY